MRTEMKKMLDRLDDKQQRWLAVGLLAGVILIVGSMLLVPFLGTILEYNETIENLEFRLNRYTGRIVDKEKMQSQVADLRKQLRNAGFFSSQETAALAIAEMQKKIKQAVQDAGGQMTSTQALPQQEFEGLTKIVVKVRLSGSMEAIRNILYAIETAKPYMVVAKIDINQVRGRRNRKTRKIEPVDKLNVNMDVVGFMRNTGQ